MVVKPRHTSLQSLSHLFLYYLHHIHSVIYLFIYFLAAWNNRRGLVEPGSQLIMVIRLSGVQFGL